MFFKALILLVIACFTIIIPGIFFSASEILTQNFLTSYFSSFLSLKSFNYEISSEEKIAHLLKIDDNNAKEKTLSVNDYYNSGIFHPAYAQQQEEQGSDFFGGVIDLFSSMFDEKPQEDVNSIQSNIENSNDTVVTTPSTPDVAILDQPQNLLPEQVDQKQFFCGNQTQGASYYIDEFTTPIPCSHLVGLAADKDGKIWVASGWSGNLLVFNPQTEKFEKTIPITNWPTEKQGNFGSMIWDMKFDKDGNLWFTDQKTNSIWKYFVSQDRFENYRLLTEGGYPLSIVFDNDGKVWYTQVFGNRLGVLDPANTENNTTKGISELDLSSQLQFQTMGPISKGYSSSNNTINNTDGTNNNTETLWFSTVTFPIGGQLIKYDIDKESLTIHDVTHTRSVPISIAEDNNGNVWTNDHAASIFLMLDPNTGFTKQYATSNSSSASKSTLPYYNEYRDGKIWFNEHYGNAIAYYDIENKTLVEYIIPSINPLWGNSSNPLKFTIDNEGSIWFTEWTENKLGVIPNEKINQLPFSISTSKDKMIIDTKNGEGDTVDIIIEKNALLDPGTNLVDNAENDNLNSNINIFGNSVGNITMYATSSISEIGDLRNLTSSFSEKTFTIDNTTQQTLIDNSNSANITTSRSNTSSNQTLVTTLEINPTIELEPGNHTLTISGRYNNDITISKIIDLEIR